MRAQRLLRGSSVLGTLGDAPEMMETDDAQVMAITIDVLCSHSCSERPNFSIPNSGADQLGTC